MPSCEAIPALSSDRRSGRIVLILIQTLNFASTTHAPCSVLRNPIPISTKKKKRKKEKVVGMGEEKFKVRVYGCWEAE